MQARAGFDAYGQTLPDWLTYTEVVTTIGGQAVTTGRVEALPQTYYGPSIPLGTGWVYGGLASPTASSSSSEATPPSSSVSSVTTDSASSSSGSLSFSSLPSFSFSTIGSTLTTDSTSSSSTSSPSMATSIMTNPASSTASLASSSSAFDPSPSTTSSSSDPSHLLPLLPSLLLPLLLLLVVILLGIWLYRRHKTYQRSTISPSSPPRFTPSFLAPILYPRNGYTPGQSQPPSTPPKKTRVFPPPPSTLDSGLRSPNEKSALLMGFTPQHHPISSSISGLSDAGDHAGTRPLTRSPGKYCESHEADKEDTSVDRPPSTSLLQRLTLGLGLFGVGISEARKPSGFSLERGLRRASYAAVPTNLNIPPPPSHSNSSSGSRSSIQARLPDIPAPSDPSEDSAPDGSSGPGTSSGAMRSIPDSQLFYSAPVPTASSRDSSSQAPSSAGLQPWSKSTPKGSGQTARSWNNREGDGISVAVPETPGTIASHAGEGDLGEFGRRPRWSSGERMRFPIPPSGFVGFTPSFGLGDRRDGQGTFGHGQEENSGRESMITSESGETSYHTAGSEKELPLIPPVGTPVSAGIPLSRAEYEYRHAALSAFGSNPSTPTRTPLQSISGGHSSQDHTSSPGRSPDPLSASSTSPIILPPLSPFGTAQGVPHAQGGQDGDGLRPRQPMTGLFTLSPPSSAGLSAEGSGPHKHSRRSYQGEPKLDLTVTPAGINSQRSVSVGEFGEPLRPGPDVSTTLVVPAATPDRSSMTASIYSQPSRAASPPSIYGTSSSGSSTQGMPSLGLRDRALRGRRSQPQLFRASLLSSSNYGEGDIPPVPISTRPGVPAEDSRKGWFSRRK